MRNPPFGESIVNIFFVFLGPLEQIQAPSSKSFFWRQEYRFFSHHQIAAWVISWDRTHICQTPCQALWLWWNISTELTFGTQFRCGNIPGEFHGAMDQVPKLWATHWQRRWPGREKLRDWEEAWVEFQHWQAKCRINRSTWLRQIFGSEIFGKYPTFRSPNFTNTQEGNAPPKTLGVETASLFGHGADIDL